VYKRQGRPQGTDHLLDQELTLKDLDLGVDLFLTVETEYWIDISAGRNHWYKNIFPAGLDEDLRGGLIGRFDQYRADSNCADGGKEKKQDLRLAFENNVEKIPQGRFGYFRCIHFVPLFLNEPPCPTATTKHEKISRHSLLIE